MNQRTFLYQLQLLDVVIDRHNIRLNEIQKIMNSNAKINSLNQSIGNIEKDLRQLNNSLSKISDEAAIIQNKISSSEKSLYDGSVKNPKELQGITSEIESLKKRLAALDEDQFDFLIQIETIENELSLKIENRNQLEQEKSEQNLAFQSEIAIIQKDISRIEIEKKPILSQIEDQYIQTYLELRNTKNKIAVSLITENACSMCGNSLPPMEIQKARSSMDDVFCSVCKRFLYSG